MGGGGYSEGLKNVDKFDYVIATHVIEHIPQLILFFQDIANILNHQGKLCLTIPDKRFCYDHFRCPTSFAECYDIYIRRTNILPFRIFDELVERTVNNAEYWWKEKNNFEHLPKQKIEFNIAKEKYMKALDGEYFDMHFSVFTPETFLKLMYYMTWYNLFPFKCIEFNKTETNTFEFNCVLELEQKVMIEGSIENEREKENLFNLLNENYDENCSIKTIENLMIELCKAKNDLLCLENDLQKMLLSKSWKITAPLRKIRYFLRYFLIDKK